MSYIQEEYIPRLLDLGPTLEKRSVFLFGPRQTGKSSLIAHAFSGAKVYDLLESDTYLKFSRAPQRLREECGPGGRLVVIDEIQRIPDLLNEVHWLIEKRRICFLLTGSSARKLRHRGVNLLGGRAREMHLFPLSYRELGGRFDLTRALNHGLLPVIYLSDDPDADLASYVGTYLNTEIAAEGLTRNVPAFSRFLEVAAASNGRMINYTNIASDAQVARSTVQEYFQILKDTLLAFEVPVWQGSIKRKPLATSKFYFFDVGVARFLQNRKVIAPGSPEFGECFETFMAHELKVLLEYRLGGTLAYWRSRSGFEVDFVVDDRIAVEVKASANIGPHDLKGLKAIREEKKLEQYVVACLEQGPRMTDGIRILPWKMFLDELWGE